MKAVPVGLSGRGGNSVEIVLAVSGAVAVGSRELFPEVPEQDIPAIGMSSKLIMTMN